MKQLILYATAVLCACSPHAAENNAQANAPQPQTAAPVASDANKASTPAQASLAEPTGPIDPRSAEAAGQVVQSYGALIEQKRWPEANALWSNAASAKQFAAQLSALAEAHLEIGTPGDIEGAAGSSYVTVPAIFYGDGADGQPFRRSADIVLRRVNDVPGSTEAQRRWHIERIDWADAG
jgi:hypothetical protein